MPLTKAYMSYHTAGLISSTNGHTADGARQLRLFLGQAAQGSEVSEMANVMLFKDQHPFV